MSCLSCSDAGEIGHVVPRHTLLRNSKALLSVSHMAFFVVETLCDKVGEAEKVMTESCITNLKPVQTL